MNGHSNFGEKMLFFFFTKNLATDQLRETRAPRKKRKTAPLAFRLNEIQLRKQSMSVRLPTFWRRTDRTIVLTVKAAASDDPSSSEFVLFPLEPSRIQVTTNTKMLHNPVAAYLI